MNPTLLMKHDDMSYERYRRAEAELAERLSEQRRAAEDAAKGRGSAAPSTSLSPTCAPFADARSDGSRKRGTSLRDGRLRADDLIARVKKDLIANSPVGRGDSAEHDLPAGQ
jgi:hypothetical protein